MKTIYFVRHGESHTNARTETVCTADSEVELTERGREQSGFIAKRAKELPIEAVISSPYVRTRDTAALISKEIGLPVEYSDLFTERRVPTSITGLTFGSEEAENLYNSWARTCYEPEERVDDGENFSDIKERGQKALDFLKNRAESHILVVSHGFFLRMLIALVMFGEAVTPQELRGVVGGTRTINTGISVFTYGRMPHHDIDPGIDRWRVLVFNDHAHLG